MQFEWSYHAALERLPERSSLTRVQVETMLNQRRYVAVREHFSQLQDRHLLWDEGRQHLIDVPVCKGGIIPTILPVDYGSRYGEWQRAEAEYAWRGEEYFAGYANYPAEIISWVEVVLSRQWKRPTHWDPNQFWYNSADVETLFYWPIRDKIVGQTGDDGVLALYRDRAFRETMKTMLEQLSPHLPSILPEGNTPAIHIKKFGARRMVPTKFFLTL